MSDMNYHVEFAIEVTAATPEAACRRAWELLSGPGAMLPVGTVLDLESGDREDIDLQELNDNEDQNQ